MKEKGDLPSEFTNDVTQEHLSSILDNAVTLKLSSVHLKNDPSLKFRLVYI